MMSRLAAVLAVLLAAGLGGCSNAGTPGTPAGGGTAAGLVRINPGKFRGNLIAPVRKPDIVLTDTAGKPFDIATRTRGTVTLLFFGYTHCPDECPLTMASTAAALRMLPAAEQQKIRVLFVTVDPARDTRARLRTWLGRFDPAFIGLRGTLKEIADAAAQVGIPVGTPVREPGGSYTLDHGTEMLAYGTDNLARESFFPSTPPGSMAHDLALLVTGHHP